MTESELRAALAVGVDLAEPEVKQELTSKERAQLEQELDAVVGLVGHPGWRKLHETFSTYRERLVRSMLSNAPDEKLPILRAKVLILDEVLAWPSAFRAQAQEVLDAPVD